jgi:hypothetical protein
VESVVWEVRWRQLVDPSHRRSYGLPPAWVLIRVLGEADQTGLKDALLQFSEVVRESEIENFGLERDLENLIDLGTRLATEFLEPTFCAKLPSIVELFLSSAVSEMRYLAYGLMIGYGGLALSSAVCDGMLGPDRRFRCDRHFHFVVVSRLTAAGVRFFSSRKLGYEAYSTTFLSSCHPRTDITATV